MEPKEVNIEFVRGDTCPVTFPLYDGEKNPVEDFDDTDMIMSVKNNFNEDNFIFQKRYSSGTISKDGNNFSFVFLPVDTESLDYGNYVFDVCVISQDFKQTIIRGTIKLTNEVTFASNE